MKCPKCEAALSNKAKSCICGWRRAEEHEYTEPRRVSCGYPGCSTEAFCKVRVGKNVWLHACQSHYVWAGAKNLEYLLDLMTV